MPDKGKQPEMGEDAETEQQAGAETPPAGGETPPVGGALPVEQLQAELERTRTALQGANRESADRRKKLEAFEKAEQDRAKKDLSEVERLKGQVAELDKRARELEAERETMIIRSAVERAATALGFHSAEDAYQLADLSGVEIDEDGKVSNVDQALKALVKARPYLVRVVDKPDTNAGATGGGKKPGEPDEERLRRKYGI
jgi:DNA repair exonuclease SbcCD ATPase subunit